MECSIRPDVGENSLLVHTWVPSHLEKICMITHCLLSELIASWDYLLIVNILFLVAILASGAVQAVRIPMLMSWIWICCLGVNVTNCGLLSLTLIDKSGLAQFLSNFVSMGWCKCKGRVHNFSRNMSCAARHSHFHETVEFLWIFIVMWIWERTHATRIQYLWIWELLNLILWIWQQVTVLQLFTNHLGWCLHLGHKHTKVQKQKTSETLLDLDSLAMLKN